MPSRSDTTLARETSGTDQGEEPRPSLPAWPVLALFLGFPAWWALGAAVLIFPILAVPMAWKLHRRGHVEVPPLFGWWFLFLGWQLWGLLTLGVNDPIEYQLGTTIGRFPGWALRTGSLSAVTVLAVYVWNLDRAVFSAQRLLGCLAWLCGVTVLGGWVGTIFPHVEFTGPLEYVIPEALRGHAYVRSLIHPSVAQLNDVLGYVAPRPKAPFEYTNTWGNNLVVLLVLLLPWAAAGSRRRRTGAVLLALAAVVPIVFSLNRGVWLGLGLAVAFLAATFVRQRRPAMALGLALGTVLLVTAVVVTPLKGVLTERADNGHSNQVRSEIAAGSLRRSLESPITGLGSARTANGGTQSLGAGRSESCAQCGVIIYGSNGFLWSTLVSNGIVGAAMYVGWLGALLWRTRSFVGTLAASTRAVLVLALFFSFFYDHYPSPLAIFWMAIVLLFRSQEWANSPATRVSTTRKPAT